MCARCHGAGWFTKPECPPDADGDYSEAHVLTWYEFMRKLRYVVRLFRCRCRRRRS